MMIMIETNDPETKESTIARGSTMGMRRRENINEDQRYDR
jgi:hypothetical protein